jgi:hypothetical protein
MTRIVSGFAVALLMSASAQATVISTYAGNPFNQFISSSCPPVCSISGYFTLADPIPPDALVAVTPLDFSFTDGFATINSANSAPNVYGATLFTLLTDSSGVITRWNNQYASATNMLWSGTAPPGCTGCSVTDEGGGFGGAGFTYYARVLDNPGTWTQAESAVPEPSTLLLLGGGLLVAKRRLKHRPA